MNYNLLFTNYQYFDNQSYNIFKQFIKSTHIERYRMPFLTASDIILPNLIDPLQSVPNMSGGTEFIKEFF